jgi:hypothetical protein
VRYVNRRTIDVSGTLYTGGGDDTLVIRRGEGIHWTGGGVSPGSTIDLRHLGSGTIDFERSGMIQILTGPTTKAYLHAASGEDRSGSDGGRDAGGGNRDREPREPGGSRIR